MVYQKEYIYQNRPKGKTMTAQKKSFLGRFMNQSQEAAVQTTEPEPVEEAANLVAKAPSPAPQQIQVEDESTPQAQNEEVQEASNNEEEWESDSEGQLTVDVYQTDAEIVIKSTIAGVSPENVDITMDNDMVTIKGEREADEEVAEDNYYYQECYWGPFSRSIILPVDVVSDKAKADLKNGILTIRLPKANKARTKKISVNAG